ncbi:hypothetical protein Asi02nite_15440 [Asanoa siamensis]|uniref:Lipoprotein n=1 Tax=Asanoa siamensis TaxID=926357 RepID=A0ABQ4CL73_9ACTN|nr:hypothetical protein Asi02nite_15440 [Asanoa siamensis]
MLSAAGCSGGGSGGPVEVDPGPALATQRPMAGEVLARWDQAATGAEIVVVEGYGGARQIGEWAADVAENHDGALRTGLIEAARALPPPPGRALIELPDGRTRSVAPLDPAATLDRVRRGVPVKWNEPARCPACRPLRVTAARAIVAPLDTVAGPAIAPAWEFGLEGSDVRLIATAVPDKAVTLLAPLHETAPRDTGVWVEVAHAVDGPALAVTFLGAPRPADRPCGVDYTGEAVESGRAVVVLVAPRRTYPQSRCTSEAGANRLTVPLDAPLGDRVVLQLHTGLPVADQTGG